VCGGLVVTCWEGVVVLVELGVVEQRHGAVLEVLRDGVAVRGDAPDGASVAQAVCVEGSGGVGGSVAAP